MANERNRVEVGFEGGQVVSVRVADEQLARLREAAEQGQGWHDIETEDGTVAVDLSKVVFVRIAGAPHTIGFSDS